MKNLVAKHTTKPSGGRFLVTGFDPFGGEKVNPAYEAVKMLPDVIAGAEIVKLEIPTVFRKSVQVLEDAIEEYEPDVVISVGQAGGRTCVAVEKVAINLAEASIPDNAGEQPVDAALREDGETAYFATVPVKAMAQNVRAHGIPCQISYSAGTYVCNCVMYHGLYLAAKKYPGMRAGFIHVPFAAEQVVERPGYAFMTLDKIAEALEWAIEAVVREKEESGEAMGVIH